MTAAQRSVDLTVVEHGGQGGIFQHASFVAESMAEAGLCVEFHTSDDAPQLSGLQQAQAFRWYRTRGRLRYVLIAFGYLVRTLPKTLFAARRSKIVHVHGLLRLPMTLATLGVARLAGAAVVFSPHNTFIRTRSNVDRCLLRWCYRTSHWIVVYAQSDASRIGRARAAVEHLDLVMPVVEPSDEVVEKWRRRLGPPPIVTSAGFIRSDKNPELFVDAFSNCPEVRAAIVGDDHGAAADAVRRSRAHGGDVQVFVSKLSDEDFAGVLRASDLVVCPYRDASQSAVVKLCEALGVPTLVSEAGGLRESGTYVSSCGSPAELRSDAIAALRKGGGNRPTPRPPDTAEFLAFYCALLQVRNS